MSRGVAIAVVREACESGVGRELEEGDVEAAVDEAMWFPAYVPYVPFDD